MFAFIDLFTDLLRNIILEIDSVSFTVSGYTFSLWNILVGFLLTSMLITVFWKGARG